MDTKTQDTSPTNDDVVNQGIAAAQAALEASSAPIFPMDEFTDDEEMRSYAIGWNSVWASDANRERFTDVVVDPKPYAGEGTLIRAFRERSDAEQGLDPMRLNFRRDHA